MALVSFIGLLICAVPLGYWLSMALASVRKGTPLPNTPQPQHIFKIAIAAHDEEAVIANTVKRLLSLDYPPNKFSVHIVADHCADGTAVLARQAGAVVYERNEGPRTGKGAALSWLFKHILADDDCDAIIIFDADTQVDSQFLRVMEAQLSQGEQVIQGQHIIRNPNDGWFPSLTWAMFLVDNRFQNLGRSNLGWSAKHMGDSICFRADVLRHAGWGEGLTEDYQLRQKLLLNGIRIAYEPNAMGYGEAPLTWAQAQAQRARWLRGTYDASQQFARQLLTEGIRRKDAALIDGAVQAHFPSYSSLTMITGFALVVQWLTNLRFGPVFPRKLVKAWSVMAGLLFIYPLFGLALEKAPFRAYLAILSGPIFILWRTYLALTARFGRRKVVWIRTEHRGEQ